MIAKNSLKNNLKAHRRQAGLSQQALASQAGISRQAYGAVEAGRAAPSTEVALRLAGVLAVAVESLFFLMEEHPEAEAELVVHHPRSLGQREQPVRAQLWRVGNRLLARPVDGTAGARHSLVDAEGVVLPASGERWDGDRLEGGREGDNRVKVRPFDSEELDSPTLSILGCDPAVALLQPGLRRHGVRLVSAEAGSYQALTGLALGEAHVAGCHLKDEETSDYNHAWVRRLVPFPCTLVTFAAWQQGLIVMPGNPKGIFGVDDLSKPGVRLINREAGSGSRSLLDRLLRQHAISSQTIVGYQREADGHLAVARDVAGGLADTGVGVQAVASALGLDFVPLEEERYDIVVPNHFLNEPAVQALLDLLRKPGLRHRVEALGGYDVSNMGAHH